MKHLLCCLFGCKPALPAPHWPCVVRNYGGRRYTTGSF